MKKNKRIRMFVIFLIILVLALIGHNLYKTYIGVTPSTKKKLISNYPYYSYSDSTTLYKQKLRELESVLNHEPVDKLKYAKLISEMHAIDFYDLNSKTNNRNVGGLDFVHPDIKNNFREKALDSDIYKDLDNAGFKKNKDLPIVSSVSSEGSNSNISIGNYKDSEGYKIKVSISYKKDLGYPKEIEYFLINKDNLIYIVKMSSN